jgi:tRNA threonylcarbamoyladenosine biosynthesis protein TsaB
MIVGALAAAGLESRQIELVATTVGPGSFTGLRVGVTTAKTFAYAVKCDVLGVSTLAALAQGIPGEYLADGPREVQAVLDTQRRELFVARFRSERTASAGGLLAELSRMSPDEIVPSDRWLSQLHPGTVVVGKLAEPLMARLPGGVIVVPPEQCSVRASVVGQLALLEYLTGRRDDVWKLAPVYLRPSYAEEKKPVG